MSRKDCFRSPSAIEVIGELLALLHLKTDKARPGLLNSSLLFFQQLDRLIPERCSPSSPAIRWPLVSAHFLPWDRSTRSEYSQIRACQTRRVRAHSNCV